MRRPPVDPKTLPALMDLMRLVGRSGAPHLRLRLVFAILLTHARARRWASWRRWCWARRSTIWRQGQPAGVAVGLGFAGFAVGWALVRFLSSAAPQLSDVVFAPVRQAAQRTAADRDLRPRAAACRWTSTRPSGPAPCRGRWTAGSRSVDFLLRILAFNLVPTGLELILAAGVLGGDYDWRFARRGRGRGGRSTPS